MLMRNDEEVVVSDTSKRMFGLVAYYKGPCLAR